MASRVGRAALAGTLIAAVTVLVASEPAEAAVCEPESQAAWVSCAAGTDGTVIGEDVYYDGPAGLVHGFICRPLSGGPYPLLVMNHGAGQTVSTPPKIDPTIDDECAQRAREGWVVLASDYRPIEYPTSPNTEACLGEAEDVVAMVDVARDLSFVDDSRIAMRGLSLGGCVTLQIHQAGLPGLVAAASINGPTDMAATHQHSKSKANQFLCWLPLPIPPYYLNAACPTWTFLVAWLEAAAGGAPGPATQAAYDARSPLHEVDDTAASDVPLMLMQGADDHLITSEQTCDFARAVNQSPGGAWDFQPVHYGTGAEGYPLIGAAPPDCDDLGTWPSSGAPWPTFPADHYLAVVDGFGHASPSADLEAATDYVDDFLDAKTP